MTIRKNNPAKNHLIERLIKSAALARKSSMAPFTGIHVGAALLGKSGKVYLGTNIESIVPSSTICAERNAMFKAISEGEREFTHIAVVAFNDRPIFPCGTCRQILSEYSEGLKVIVSDLRGRHKIYGLEKLLPFPPKIKSKKR